MDDLKITTLVENTARGRGLLAEHGLAFAIEVKGRLFLMDTGQGFVLKHNAPKLGISLDKTEAIIISHGHDDHTGGLRGVLELLDRPKVFAHPNIFEQKFVQHGEAVQEIGLPMSETDLAAAADIVRAEGPTEVGEGLFVTGPVPRQTDYEDTGGDFFLDEQARQRDEIPDDQSAFIETGEGTVVILGCAHSGVVNVLQYVRELTDNRPIHTVIGGMHLRSANEERLDRTVDVLRELNVRQLLPAHCTGFDATARFRREFPDTCTPCTVGTVVEF